jgi:hypothetical protein
VKKEAPWDVIIAVNSKVIGWNLDFDYNTVDLARKEYDHTMGDHELSSDLPVLQKMGVKVNGIYFILE